MTYLVVFFSCRSDIGIPRTLGLFSRDLDRGGGREDLGRGGGREVLGRSERRGCGGQLCLNGSSGLLVHLLFTMTWIQMYDEY
jgi:hypothetical protein